MESSSDLFLWKIRSQHKYSCHTKNQVENVKSQKIYFCNQEIKLKIWKKICLTVPMLLSSVNANIPMLPSWWSHPNTTVLTLQTPTNLSECYRLDATIAMLPSWSWCYHPDTTVLMLPLQWYHPTVPSHATILPLPSHMLPSRTHNKKVKKQFRKNSFSEKFKSHKNKIAIQKNQARKQFRFNFWKFRSQHKYFCHPENQAEISDHHKIFWHLENEAKNLIKISAWPPQHYCPVPMLLSWCNHLDTTVLMLPF